MKNYEPVIGLEVHVELNTVSKMFCRNSTRYFGETPNTHVCPVCLGLPGSLPYVNEAAIEACIKIGLALQCEIAEQSVFERKNYFYPDLPKGYQISQHRWPLCKNGVIIVSDSDSKKNRIKVNRVHLEEDTAKMMHIAYSKSQTEKEQSTIGNLPFDSLVDFNRSGVPLVEIVTEPDFRDTTEIKNYAKKLQQLFRYLGVSNADMEKGDMRLEANVSVRSLAFHPRGVSKKLPGYRVELKNINSFRFMVAAVEYEIRRQTETLEAGGKLTNETRGWDENRKQTYVQRVKEAANDYRYFPEPDIPAVEVGGESIVRLQKGMPELPWEKIERFITEYSLNSNQAAVLTETQEFADYFEEAAEIGQEHNLSIGKIANTLINKKFNRDEILPARLITMLHQEAEKPTMSEEELIRIVESVIKENKTAVADYKRGKENVLQFLVGQIMARTRGQADPSRARDALTRKIKNWL